MQFSLIKILILVVAAFVFVACDGDSKRLPNSDPVLSKNIDTASLTLIQHKHHAVIREAEIEMDGTDHTRSKRWGRRWGGYGRRGGWGRRGYGRGWGRPYGYGRGWGRPMGWGFPLGFGWGR